MVSTKRGEIRKELMDKSISEFRSEDIEDLSKMEKDFYFELADAVNTILTFGNKLSYVNISKELKVSVSELQDYTSEILDLEDRFIKGQKDERKNARKRTQKRSEVS